MLIKSALRLSPNEPGSSFEANFASGGASGDIDSSEQVPDEFKTNPIFQRLYNESRKTQRILGKKDKEIETMRSELAAMKAQFQGIAGLFGGQGAQQSEDGKPVSYLEKVRNADRAIREQDPNSGGLSLTLEGAELLEKLRAENADLRRMTERMMNPQFTAEQSLFMNTESGLKAQIAELYGSDDAVAENYPDFERVAIERMKAIKADPKKWNQLLTQPKVQQDFIKNVIAAKLPKMNNVPGWQKIETYGRDEALRDMQRAEQLAKDGKTAEASKLQTKARQALLPYTLGIAMD